LYGQGAHDGQKRVNGRIVELTSRPSREAANRLYQRLVYPTRQQCVPLHPVTIGWLTNRLNRPATPATQRHLVSRASGESCANPRGCDGHSTPLCGMRDTAGGPLRRHCGDAHGCPGACTGGDTDGRCATAARARRLPVRAAGHAPVSRSTGSASLRLLRWPLKRAAGVPSLATCLGGFGWGAIRCPRRYRTCRAVSILPNAVRWAEPARLANRPLERPGHAGRTTPSR
jgi:hypothetical protein